MSGTLGPRELDLLAAYLDGELTAEQDGELAEIAASRPEFMLELRRFLVFDDALNQLGREERSTEAFLRALRLRRSPMMRAPAGHRRGRPRLAPRGRWGTWRTRLLAMAAVLLIATLAALVRPEAPAPPPAQAAQAAPAIASAARLVAAAAGSRIERSGGSASAMAGTALLAGDLVVTPEATLAFDDGSRVRLRDATVRLGGGSTTLALVLGRLDAEIVPRSGRDPFAISTGQSLVTVIGTRFRLQADGTTSRLAVTEGTVRFSGLDADPSPLVVGAGQAATCTGRPQALGLDAGLIGHWRLDDGSGQKAASAVAGTGPGTIVRARWEADGLAFDGVDAHVVLPLSPALRAATMESYSVSANVRPQPVPAGRDEDKLNQVIVGRTGYTAGLYYREDGRFMMQHFLADRLSCAAHSRSAYPAGTWHHLVGVVDHEQRSTRLYVDGRQVGSLTWTTNGPPFDHEDQTWKIGINRPSGGPARWAAAGVIADVRIYQRALGADEVAALAILEAR